MIRLVKGERPPILQERAAQWRAEFIAARTSGSLTPTIRFRYRHPQIKAALRTETNEKCAYCESKIPHTFPGETEHIVPSSVRPELVVEWSNLTLACTECNRRKGDYYDEAEPLLNPYQDDPSHHIRFYGPLCLHAPGSVRGLATVLRLELSRIELHERRADRLRAIQALVDRWEALPSGPTKELVKDEILKEAYPDKEYSAAVRSFLHACQGW